MFLRQKDLSSISADKNYLDRTFDCEVGGDMELEVSRTLDVDFKPCVCRV